MREERKVWTVEEVAAAYEEMAEINLALAEDFADLEAEACTIIEEHLQRKIEE